MKTSNKHQHFMYHFEVLFTSCRHSQSRHINAHVRTCTHDTYVHTHAHTHANKQTNTHTKKQSDRKNGRMRSPRIKLLQVALSYINSILGSPSSPHQITFVCSTTTGRPPIHNIHTSAPLLFQTCLLSAHNILVNVSD